MVVKKKKTLVLLDSHAVLHRAFHALPGFTSPKGEPTGALYGFVSTLLKTIDDFNPDYLVACFDLPEPTFRHRFYEKYKAKRPKMESELSAQITKAKKVLELFGVPVYEKAGFEADDVLATVVEKMKPELKPKNIEIVVVTGDLDTLQLVQTGVKVYTMKRGIKESMMYDTKAVKDRYGFGPKLLPDFKGLMGDPSDNIIGVVGIGEKTAKTLIHNFGSLEDIYKKLKKDKTAFEKVGIKQRIIKILEENEEEAFFSKALAEVRIDVPIDFSLEDAVWGEGFDKEKLRDFFQDLGFRTLFQRLPEEFKKEDEVIEEEVNEELEKRAKLAYWMLDSRKTNVPIKDILFDTKASTLKEALEVLENRIKKTEFSKLYLDIETPLIDIFAKMEQRGVLLDTDYLKKLSKDYHKKLDGLQKKIWELAGEEFNIKSPKQLSEVLFTKMGISPKGMRKTSTGAISTRFSELEKIKNRHPIIEEIFSYRELAKLTSTYVDNLPKMVDKENRLHTTFNQTGTSTGRISSSEPNLQNIPVRTEFGSAVRKAFVAPKGYSFVSFDYSQIELRIAASLSGDKKLINAFKTGADIHAKVASEVFNTPFEEVTSNMRRNAKVINFGILYGMGINSLKKNLGCSQTEARNFYDEYFHDFQGMAEYIEESKQEAAKDGFTKTILGRRRYLPEINSPIVFIKKEAERMAVNAPIQGTAADIIKLAMVRLDELLKEKGFDKDVNLVLQIHDELIFEIKEDKIDEIASVIEVVMEEDKLLGDVPVLVDVLVGQTWGELEKLEVKVKK